MGECTLGTVLTKDGKQVAAAAILIPVLSTVSSVIKNCHPLP